MKYQSSNTGSIFNIERGYNKRTICPECSHNRSKKKDKDLEFYEKDNRFYCHHCESLFFEYKPYEPKQYKLPEWENKTNLIEKAVKWFEGRMIKQETLNELKIYSDISYMPQFEKETDVICFPYFRDGKVVNIKYRGAKKSFKNYTGAELIFYNLDALKENDEIIICEGELDLLSYFQVGYKNVISVPSGKGNFEYLDNYIDLFKPIKKIFISVDNDTVGLELKNELVRRLGAEKCYIVSLKECKDANEFIIKYGVELKECVKNAKKVPIKGIVEIDSVYNEIIDLYENGLQPGKTIFINQIDSYITWKKGILCIGTGEPGDGKSEVVDFIVTKLNTLYGWKAAYFTPENYPLSYHYSKIYEKIVGTRFKMTPNDDTAMFSHVYEYIKNNYFYIFDDDNLTIDSILEKAKYLVSVKGIDILVIDPYNKIDHQYTNNETETQYISRLLDKLTSFAKYKNVLVFLVAHPQKLQPGQKPNLYSISGSAHFYNKTDVGFSAIRNRDENNIKLDSIEIHWQKCRFKYLGKQGISYLDYNKENGRFENAGNKIQDRSNWLQFKGSPKEETGTFDREIGEAPF